MVGSRKNNKVNEWALGLSLLMIFSAIVFSCKDTIPQTAKVIVIQPLGDFLQIKSEMIYTELRKIHPNVLLRTAQPLPFLAYYPTRDRYRADSLIRYLSKLAGKDTIFIGLTNVDISTTKAQSKDWGIMGLGYCPGNACIISTFRLGKNDPNNQDFKVAVHELGHTQGLPHCKSNKCFMRDAEGKNHLDEEKGFCPLCSRLLKDKRWRLK